MLWLGHRSILNSYDKAKENIYQTIDEDTLVNKKYCDREMVFTYTAVTDACD